MDSPIRPLTPGLFASATELLVEAFYSNPPHRSINETSEEVAYLEVGDRTPGDEVGYPDDDLKAVLVDGKWKFVQRDGTPYP